MRLWHGLVISSCCWLVLPVIELQAVVKSRLLHLVVSVNGQIKEVNAGERLEVIRGDQVTLLHGALHGKTQGPDLINFVGFRSDGPKRRNLNDDLNIPIDTSSLKRGWSENKQGRIYTIETSSKGSNLGNVYVSIMTPELKKLRLVVGDQIRELANGESLAIQAEDRIKIDSIQTNNSIVDQEVRVEFKEQLSSKNKMIELQLMYRAYVFATVYFNVETIDDGSLGRSSINR